MGRFSAAAQVAAFFLIGTIGSGPAQACENENCGRVQLDVTAAVDAATRFVVSAVRSLNPWSRAGEVDIAQLDPQQEFAAADDTLQATLTVAEYAAAYDARDGQRSIEMPGFRHRYAWQLTYRDQGALALDRPAQLERRPLTDVTLDDSRVVGLRFELDYGWKR